MKAINLIIICGTLIITCGCVPQNQTTLPQKIEDTKFYDASFDETWAALIETLSDMTLPIESIEKESGLITTRFVNFADGINADNSIKQVATRPSVFLGTWNSGRYTLNIFVADKGELGTRIKVSAHIEAYENNVTNKWYVCKSLGVLEKRIFKAIKEII